jgi:hypothetical protein
LHCYDKLIKSELAIVILMLEMQKIYKIRQLLSQVTQHSNRGGKKEMIRERVMS